MDLSKDNAVGQVISRLAAAKPAQGAVKADGTWGSYAPLLTSHIVRLLKRPILFISAHIDDADRVCDDLQTFSGLSVQTFPVWEGPPSAEMVADEIRFIFQ